MERYENNYNDNLHNAANSSTYENARILRQLQTPAELKLWELLRNRKMLNFKFRRQHPFGNYVLDFYCHECKLCVEADGDIHLEKDIIEYDAARTRFLNENGITVLRFTNDEILNDTNFVKDKIGSFIKNK